MIAIDHRRVAAMGPLRDRDEAETEEACFVPQMIARRSIPMFVVVVVVVC